MNPLVPVFVLSTFAAPWLVWRWLVSCWSWPSRNRCVTLALLGCAAALHWVSGWLLREQQTLWLSWVHAGAVCLLFLMMTVGVPAGLLSAGLWGWSRLSHWRARPQAPVDSERRKVVVETGAGVALLGLSGSALGWGFVRGRHDYELTEVSVKIAGLPKVLDGYTIVQISDLHTGPFVGEMEFSLAADVVRRARPDLICVSGDLVDADARWAPLVASQLSRLPSRDGIFAAPGNHDHYAGWSFVQQALQRAGVVSLVNRGQVIRPGDGGGFALLGVDDPASMPGGAPGPDLDRAIKGVPPDLARILISHRPSSVDQWAGRVALQMSGHTHGGQINPAGITGRLLFKYSAGSYVVNETTLYVNRGLGTGGPPTRVNAPPEVTRLVLVSA